MLVEAQLDLIKSEDWEHLMAFEHDAADLLFQDDEE